MNPEGFSVIFFMQFVPFGNITLAVLFKGNMVHFWKEIVPCTNANTEPYLL